jgi:DNA (cytosine-5)-methyltransferase 1
MALKPKYLCLENVKAMVSGKFVGMFNVWQRELEKLGYANFAQVLNSKDYGVPQNRERIFLVSIRIDNENDYPKYYFPQPFRLEKKLKDVLEDNVDEKYYLSDKMIECFQHRTEVAIEKGNGFRFSPTNGGGCGKAITTLAGNRTDDNFIIDEQDNVRTIQKP